jgi:hypothetical protein
VEAAVIYLLAEVALELHRPQLDRARALVVAPHRVGHRRQHALLDVVLARQVLGLRHVGHLGLVGHAGLIAMERHRHGEDRLAVLDRDHPAGGEALAVADAVDLVDDRDRGIATEHEIGVQRMRWPAADIDGAACRHQRLADDLPAEHTLAADLGGAAAKQVHLELLEVENAEQILEGRGHRKPFGTLRISRPYDPLVRQVTML